MPQEIQIGDDVLVFPDDMPDDQIKAAIDKEYFAEQKIPEAPAPQIPEQPADSPRKFGKTESAITGIGQGATAGFGDEIIAGLSAPVIYGGSRLAEAAGYDTQGLANKSLKEVYRQEQLKGQSDIREAEKQNPKSYLAGNVGGAIGTGIGAATTKGGAMLGNLIKSGSLPTRMAKGAAVGSSSGALSGAGVADYDKVGQGAKEGAKYGAALGALVPAAGSVIKKATSKSKNLTTADEIRDVARESYKYAEEKGGILKPHVINKFVDEVKDMNPQTELGKSLVGDEPFTKLAIKISKFKDKPASLRAVQEVDEILGDQIDNFVDAQTGKLTKQGMKIAKIQDSLRSKYHPDNLKEADVIGGKEGFEALKEGSKLWASSARLRDIEKIITRAEMTYNPTTALKTGFRTLYNNPKRMRGFKPDERKLIKKAAESGAISDFLRSSLGSRLLPIISIGTGGGLPASIAAQAGSMGARSGATRLQLRKASKIAEAIGNKAIKPRANQAAKRYPYSVPIAGSVAGSMGQKE